MAHLLAVQEKHRTIQFLPGGREVKAKLSQIVLGVGFVEFAIILPTDRGDRTTLHTTSAEAERALSLQSDVMQLTLELD